MRYTAIVLFLAILFMGSCTPTQSPVLPAPSSSPSLIVAVSSPISTQLLDTQEPKVIQPDPAIIDGLYRVGIRILNENGSDTKSWALSFNGMKVPGAIVDQNGLTITIASGSITISPNRVRESIRVIDGAIVVDYTPGTHTAVYDPAFTTEKWKGRWVSKYEALRENYSANPDDWVQVHTYAELEEAVKLGKLLSREFPKGTYLPPLNKLYIDYDEEPYITEGDYNSRYPFGTRDDYATTKPFMYINHILLLPNEHEGRKYYACILQEAVYNADKTKGVLNIPFSDPDAKTCLILLGSAKIFGGRVPENETYILPAYDIKRDSLVRLFQFEGDVLRRQGLVGEQGIDAKVKEYVLLWFRTGILPKELEKMYLWGATRTFKKWD